LIPFPTLSLSSLSLLIKTLAFGSKAPVNLSDLLI
jgi:hypothetical protein